MFHWSKLELETFRLAMIFPRGICSDKMKLLISVTIAVIYIYVEQANVELHIAHFLHKRKHSYTGWVYQDNSKYYRR